MKLSYSRQRLRRIVQELKEKPAISLVSRVVKALGEDNAGDMAGSLVNKMKAA
jgi:hypothetical protein